MQSLVMPGMLRAPAAASGGDGDAATHAYSSVTVVTTLVAYER